MHSGPKPTFSDRVSKAFGQGHTHNVCNAYHLEHIYKSQDTKFFPSDLHLFDDLQMCAVEVLAFKLLLT